MAISRIFRGLLRFRLILIVKNIAVKFLEFTTSSKLCNYLQLLRIT